MIELFKMGGPLFMGILTLQFAGMVFFAIRYVAAKEKTDKDLDLVKSMGLFAMITGILGQLIGLFSAFEAIQEMGSVSPAMLAGGLKVSMISTLYGMTIFLFAYILWLILNIRKS